MLAKPSVGVLLGLLIGCQAELQEAEPPASGGSSSSGGTAGSAGSAGASLVLTGGSAGSMTGVSGAGGVGGVAGSGGSGGSAAAGGEPPTPNEGATEIKIMTFNVRTKDADSADAPLGNDWPKRVGLALEVLSSYAPDVVGLQEATQPQVDALAPGFEVLSANGVAVLYNADKLEGVEGGVFNVGNYGNSDPWGERWCNWQRFKVKGRGVEFVFFNTHLSTAGDNVPQSQFVLDEANAFHAEGLPVVVVGDFNYNATGTIAEKGFDDVVTDHGGTFHAFGGGRSGPRLDFIAARLLQPVASQVDTRSDASGEQTVYPSDHYPVWATLRLD